MTEQPVCWEDSCFRSEHRIVLTQRELNIPGLRTFAWHDMNRAVPALKDHYHRNCFEITFVTEGSITFCTDRQEQTVRGGDAFLTFPGEVHSTNEIPMSVGEICWMQLSVSEPDNFLFLGPEAAQALIASLYRVSRRCIRTGGGMAARLLKLLIRDVLKSARPFDRYQAANLIVGYLYQLINSADASGPLVTPDIALACDYVRDNLCESLTLDEIAAACRLSVSQFKQKFKGQIGVTPRNYINRKKIEQIKTILTPGANLTRISSDYGFCNSSYFSKVFKKYTGRTPTEFVRSADAAGNPGAPPKKVRG